MQIIYIHGFLGTGKTTLINNIIKNYSNKEIAVVVNEYSDSSFDSASIIDKEVVISEVNSGSIFCSCKSGEFSKTIAELIKLDLDYILVETSGFSNPDSLDSLMSEIEKTSQKSLQYRNITIVDGINLYKLLNTLLIVKHQLYVADKIILNKIDLIDNEKQKETIELIKEYSKAPIIKTKYCQIDDVLDDFYSYSKSATNDTKTRNLNLRFLKLAVDERLSSREIERFLNNIKDKAYRAKGILQLKDGLKSCQMASGQIEIIDSDLSKTALMIFYSSEVATEKNIMEIYQDLLANLPNEY